MARDGFMKIFWGFLLVFLDFRFNRFDIFPDFLGYILITWGLSILAPMHQRFDKAKIYAGIMIVFSLIDLVQIKAKGEAEFILFLINTMQIILNLIMVWNICQGIIELANTAQNQNLAEKANFRRNLYMAVMIIVLCCCTFTLFTGDIETLLAIPLVILGLIAMILIVELMLRAARELPGKVLSPEQEAISEENTSTNPSRQQTVD
ncbi:MAG: hypothetical protein ACYTBZ_02175 [Planctomycetota bacterium]|jgi:hypothetical protein